ncbi:hypothetical protein OUZ56_009141 [Daphnia magna]|uniref:Secreted protein n=1 Tax=Daphnia magna TaxID=35525 RepID=A0ABR0AF59_9CRUS|nr:hypothetical protein OUZ56_009141 [Daphnia magna]
MAVYECWLGLILCMDMQRKGAAAGSAQLRDVCLYKQRNSSADRWAAAHARYRYTQHTTKRELLNASAISNTHTKKDVPRRVAYVFQC